MGKCIECGGKAPWLFQLCDACINKTRRGSEEPDQSKGHSEKSQVSEPDINGSRIERPRGVAILAWLQIAVCGLGLIPLGVLLILELIDSFPNRGWMDLDPFAQPLLFVSLCFILIVGCGYGMLKGVNWARICYLALISIGLIIVFRYVELGELSLWRFLPAAAYYLIALIVLTRRDANKYFNSPNPVKMQPENT